MPAPITAPPSSLGAPLDAEGSGEPEDMIGALRFNEGQTAVAEGRWSDAVALFERPTNALAYARFQASGLDEQTTAHAFELLDYAQ